MKAKIYKIEDCQYCRLAKTLLEENDVKVSTIDVNRSKAKRAEMVNLTGQEGVPVIQIQGETIIGYDRTRLKQILGIEDEED